MDDKRRKIKKKETIIIVILLFVAILLLLIFNIRNKLSSEVNKANIYVHGELYDSIELTKRQKEKTIKITGKLNVEIILSGEEIYFYKSECPDKVCINAGKLRYKYESAACLPADVSIVIE